MKQYGTAVCAGKFWPFHLGHVYMLDCAVEVANHLEILLVARPWEFPTGEQRALEIHDYMSTQMHSYSLHIVGDINTDDTNARSHALWAMYTKAILGYTPGVVVSSESYGAGWARAMGADHVTVDPDRRVIKTSGTQVRQNYSDASEWLPPATVADTVPRVVVLGAESTGTTTLAQQLGAHYETLTVPEFGRQIAESAIAAGSPIGVEDWDVKLFEVIAHGQDALEERYARDANRVLICDTDSYATAVWWKRYHKGDIVGYAVFKEYGMRQALRDPRCRTRLYIVTSELGIPWENDGTRDGQAERTWMESEFLKNQFELSHKGVQFVYATGNREARLELSIRAVDKFLAGERIKAPLTV